MPRRRELAFSAAMTSNSHPSRSQGRWGRREQFRPGVNWAWGPGQRLYQIGQNSTKKWRPPSDLRSAQLLSKTGVFKVPALRHLFCNRPHTIIRTKKSFVLDSLRIIEARFSASPKTRTSNTWNWRS